MHAPYFVNDLPAGGRRIVQKEDASLATVKAGQTNFVQKNATDDMPGKLIRGPQIV